MIAPLSSSRSGFIKTLKEKYGSVIIGFTGWCLDSRYKYFMGLDYAFDISDHSDFPELVGFAKKCAPSKIYTVHGFASEFAAYLNTLGFDAQPLDDEGVPARVPFQATHSFFSILVTRNSRRVKQRPTCNQISKNLLSPTRNQQEKKK